MIAMGRHAWAFDAHYKVLSHEVRIRSNRARLGRMLEPLLAPFRSEPASGAPTYSILHGRSRTRPEMAVFLDGEDVHLSDSPAAALDYVVWNIHEVAMERSGRFLAFHAAAAALEGRGLLLPAPPESGKSTLVAGLVRDGWSFLADEYATVDARTGLLHPFPRALWLAPESIALLGDLKGVVPEALWAEGRSKYFLSPDALRAEAVGVPCPVRLVVAPSYEARGRTLLEPLSRAEAGYLLADNCFNFARFADRGLRTVASVVGGARCYRLRFGRLAEAVATIRELIEGG